MAVRKRSPQRARGRSTLEKSFRDAQAVLSGYIESGGKQVKDTMTSLLHIFDLDKGGARTRAPRRAAAKPRASAARKRKAPARHAASRSAATTRRSKRPATTKRRSARSAKRAPRI
jgi:hypothetical protein